MIVYCMDCPTCGDSFDTEQGVKSHHAQVHGESISGFEYECGACGETFRDNRSPDHSEAPEYCSHECYSESLAKGSMEDGECEECGEVVPYNKRFCDYQCYWEWLADGNSSSYDEEVREKISKTHKELVEKGESPMQSEEFLEARDAIRQTYEVEETGHVVDSRLEEAVDLALHDAGVEYEAVCSTRETSFELSVGRYTPDFTCGNVIVEVKGIGGYIHWPERMEQTAREMAEREDVIFVVVGPVEMEHYDAYFSMEEMDGFIEYVKSR